ncbi:hypothetical protein JOQ06_000024 [Pogonophryne albipinna]|uniref:Uncharacterized protein n=1 Tax=Pogonophryne albipinna TaxID=1090488 RepID=A0AAD6A8G4_9TELE|nr:hypothetical protein JOQ06_000024 [Pogonophryne albipinna]
MNLQLQGHIWSSEDPQHVAADGECEEGGDASSSLQNTLLYNMCNMITPYESSGKRLKRGNIGLKEEEEPEVMLEVRGVKKKRLSEEGSH